MTMCIGLSRREFAVLAALMDRPGTVLSKSDLEAKLYGWQEEVESNTVEVHVHKLRSENRTGQDRDPARDRLPDEARRIMNSLKGRLFLILVAATSLIWLAATCWIYVGATREIESVLDARLQEAARMVLSLASGNGAAAALKDGDSAPAPEIMSYERQLSCQIWSLDGRLVARSSGAPDESLSDRRAGFSQRLIKGETWRVYTAEDAAKGVRVSVGDRLGLRSHLVGEIIKGLLAPLLLAIPLLGLLIWASLSRGLRPLQALARELGRRNADDMSPVETGTIPAEIRPVVASLNHLFRKVRDAMQHERELTAFAAHELRTPLAGLRTQAQIAMVAGDGNGSRGRIAPDRRRRRSDHPDGPPIAGDSKARFHPRGQTIQRQHRRSDRGSHRHIAGIGPQGTRSELIPR